MGGWFMHGSVAEDDGQPGGDEQIGKAASIRFTNFDMPGRLVTVYVYATAKELNATDQPECTHEEPPGWKCKNGWDDLHKPNGRSACSCWLPAEHLRCSYDMDTLVLTMQTEFMICRDIEDPGSTEEWCDYQYEDLDTAPFTGTIEEILVKADALAPKRVRMFNAERDIHWDGRPF